MRHSAIRATAFAILLLHAGGAMAGSAGPQISEAVRHGSSRPLSELAALETTVPRRADESPATAEVPIHIPLTLQGHVDTRSGPDVLRQLKPSATRATHTIDFEGYGSDDNLALFGTAFAPPDTQGDVSATHYVQWNNLGFIVFDKSGNPLLGPTPGKSLWAGFGGVCESDNAGDPIVLYDHLADRWLFSQFTDDANTDGHQCVAVSQTGDPTGAYWLYDFLISASAFNDYPKLGLWPDAYYLTVNEFVGTTFTGVRVAALEREAMLAGNAAAQVDFFLAAGNPGVFSLQPSHLEGGTNPPVDAPNTLVMACDDEVWDCDGASGGDDGYRLWAFHVDWVTPSSSSLSPLSFVSSSEFDSSLCAFYPCVPQPGSSQLLDALGQFTMYRAQYRNFGGYETLVTSHTVDVDGAETAGLRWVELRSVAGGPWTLRQEGSYGPDDGVHRWMPSAAMDGDGNICLVYSLSDDSSVYPSLAYACHQEGVDELGALGQETLCVSGSGTQEGSNRWGDYATLSIDPSDDCSFWGTGEYVATGGSYQWNSRICSFVLDTCICDTGIINGTVSESKIAEPIAGAQISADPGPTTTSDGVGHFSMEVCEGSHDLTALRHGYYPQTVTDLMVTAGGITTQNFELDPAPQYELSGTVSDGGCSGWPLYARVDIDHLDPEGDQSVFTDPATGAFSAPVFDGHSYELTVSALASGYAVHTEQITISGGDPVRHIGLVPDASCTAPGYGRPGLQIDEDFEGSWPPAAWTVVDNESGSPVLWSDLAGSGMTGNYTNGSGDAASASSAAAGNAEFDTELRTPAFDVGGATTATLSFRANYQNYYNEDYFEVDLSTDGGSSWSTLLSWNEDHGAYYSTPGEQVTLDLLAVGATGSDNVVRFHYFDPNTNEWDWYAQVDEVQIGDGSCQCVGGAIYYGQVRDGNTGAALDGALVATDTGRVVTSGPTPVDPAWGDGFYLSWAEGTASTLSASATPYGTRSQSISPLTGSQRLDFELPVGWLEVAPTALGFQIVTNSAPAASPLTLHNLGGLTLDYEILEFNTAPASAAVAPSVRLQPGPRSWRLLRESDAVAWMASLATDASGERTTTSVPPAQPTAPGPGAPLGSYPATGSSWGLGLDRGAGDLVWLGDLEALGQGGSDHNLEYTTTPGWTTTGRSVDWSDEGIPWMADMAYNARSGLFWQVDVGGSDCIREFDPDTQSLTGRQICPEFGATMRGLAYDPVSDSFFAGSWRDGGFIVRFDSAGTILNRWDNGWPVSGLAFNPSTGHLFALGSTDAAVDLVVFDAADPGLPPLFGFATGMAAFAQAGLDMDCQGRLWAVDQSSQNILLFDSAEDGPCDVFGIPWFEVNGSTTGSVDALSELQLSASADPDGITPGCYEGLLAIENSTPYGAITTDLGARVAFADSDEGNPDSSWVWAHPYIHGLADAGITSGCGGGNFCADAPVSRGEAAIWILRGHTGADVGVPSATGLIFDDVGSSTLGAAEIEELARRGATVGSNQCTGVGAAPHPTFCPTSPLNRAKMARLILLTLEDGSYAAPTCAEAAARLFADVPWTHEDCAEIEELARRNLVFASGRCSGQTAAPFTTFCPDQDVSRGELAAYLGTAYDTLAPCEDPTTASDPSGACTLDDAHCICEELPPLECVLYREGDYGGHGTSCTSIYCDDLETGSLDGWSSHQP